METVSWRQYHGDSIVEKVTEKEKEKSDQLCLRGLIGNTSRYKTHIGQQGGYWDMEIKARVYRQRLGNGRPRKRQGIGYVQYATGIYTWQQLVTLRWRGPVS